MHTVVIPVDADRAGIDMAVSYVSSLQGDRRAIVTHVKPDIDVMGSDGGHVSVDSDEFEVPETVGTLERALSDAGVPTEVEIRGGDVVEQTLSVASSYDADQLIVPTKKRSPVGKFVFGSRTVDFVRQSPLPVTLATDPP